jgi:hypothetical protein
MTSASVSGAGALPASRWNGIALTTTAAATKAPANPSRTEDASGRSHAK